VAFEAPSPLPELKKRFAPFWPISHTQIYPALAQLEEQGFSRYHLVEQHAMRPDKRESRAASARRRA
jgi:DNA-binding PadR family transcriptional regulator